jgi:peptidoglycan/LPS O-acetylase OafA/YrhL
LFATYLLLGLVTFVQNLQDASWANAFLANWYYLKQNLNYFATGNLNLFQHYWSLAIEEQFYLIWPLILFATKRSKLIPISLFAISLILFITYSYPTNFYGFPQRAWELIAGAMLAIYQVNLKQVLATWSPWILLLSLLIPSKLPQNIATIVVVALSAFFICASANATKKGAIFVIGELSFSLYLVHFPVIKIFDELHPNFGAASRSIVIIVITSAIALLNHGLIENPLRYRTYKRPSIAILGFLFALTLLEIAIYFTRGHYV